MLITYRDNVGLQRRPGNKQDGAQIVKIHKEWQGEFTLKTADRSDAQGVHDWKMPGERHFRRPGARDERQLVPLCFKVPAQFRHWLKAQALARNLTMTELVVVALEHYAELSPCEPLALRKEIRK